MALDHVSRGGDAIDSTPGGRTLEGLNLYERFQVDTRLTDLIWIKASTHYATNAEGAVHLFVDGADPARVFNIVEKPLLQANGRITSWKQHPNPGKNGPTSPGRPPPAPTAPDAPAPATPPPTPDAPSSPGAAARDPALHAQTLSEALPPHLRDRVPVEIDPALSGTTVRIDYDFSGGMIQNVRLRAGTGATPEHVAAHAQTVQAVLRYSGLRGRIRVVLERIGRSLGLVDTPPVGSAAWRATHELRKLDAILQQRQAELLTTTDAARRQALQSNIDALDFQLQAHELALGDHTVTTGPDYIADVSASDLLGAFTRPNKFNKTTLDRLFTRDPDLHDGVATRLNHSPTDPLSRNHVVGYMHEIRIVRNSLMGRDNAEIAAWLTSQGVPPKGTGDTQLITAIRSYVLKRFNDNQNLYIGNSAENSVAGNNAKIIRDQRDRISAEDNPDAYRELTRRYAEEVVDVPRGKATGGKELSAASRATMDRVDNLYNQWDRFMAVREESLRIRRGEIDEADASLEYFEAKSALETLSSDTHILTEIIHDGNVSTNVSITIALRRIFELELMLSESVNGIHPDGTIPMAN